MADNKNWAQEYVSGPLYEPTPGEETGPGASFQPSQRDSTSKANGSTTVTAHNTGSSTSTNPFRRHKASASHDGPFPPSPTTTPPSKAGASTHTGRISIDSTYGPGPSPSYSARNGKGPSATIAETSSPTARRSIDSAGPSHPRRSIDTSKPPPTSSNNRPRRSSSLRARYPGDPSIQPLHTLAREERHARRAPHLTKKHHQGSDSIDRLDSAALAMTGGGGYHHEGPYDAASLARNNSYTSAPVAALGESNREALRATPREAVQDSLQRHRPMDNVASVPPGEWDQMGRVYQYRQGAEEDMMRNGGGTAEGGAYKRWPGIDYLAEDLKGKGEPSYSIEKSLKEHRRSREGVEGDAVELVDRSRGSRSGRSGSITTTRGEHTNLDAQYRDHRGHDDAGIMGTAGGYEFGEPGRVVGPERRSEGGFGAYGEDGQPVGSSSGREGSEGRHGRGKSGSGSGLDGLKRRIGSLRKKERRSVVD